MVGQTLWGIPSYLGTSSLILTQAGEPRSKLETEAHFSGETLAFQGAPGPTVLLQGYTVTLNEPQSLRVGPAVGDASSGG